MKSWQVFFSFAAALFLLRITGPWELSSSSDTLVTPCTNIKNQTEGRWSGDTLLRIKAPVLKICSCCQCEDGEEIFLIPRALSICVFNYELEGGEGGGLLSCCCCDAACTYFDRLLYCSCLVLPHPLKHRVVSAAAL